MTHKVSTGKGTFVFAVVQDDWSDFELNEADSNVLMFCTPEAISHLVLPPGSYTFIGTTKDISEEQAGEIVSNIFGEKNRWKDYVSLMIPCKTATESLRSLLIANNLSPELNYAILKLTNG